MQVVGRKQAAIAVELVDRGAEGFLPWVHLHFMHQVAAFPQIAGRAGCHNIFPRGLAALRTWQHMVEGQVIRRRAILAREFIAQEYVEPCEGRRARWLDIGFEWCNKNLLASKVAKNLPHKEDLGE